MFLFRTRDVLHRSITTNKIMIQLLELTDHYKQKHVEREEATFSHLKKKSRFSFERMVSGLLQPLHMTYSSDTSFKGKKH